MAAATMSTAAATARGTTTASAEPTPSGGLSGTVSVPAGHPAGGIRVIVYRLDFGSEGERIWHDTATALTATNGSWQIDGLLDGTYQVGFTPPPESKVVGEFLGGGATYFDGNGVVIEAGASVSGLDEPLPLEARIAGTVRSEAGEPLGGVMVLAYEGYDHYGPQEWKVVRADWTDHEGRYELHGLRATTHRLRFSDVMSPENGYLTEYYDDVQTLEEAKDLELREGAVRTDLKVRLAGDRGATDPTPTDPAPTEPVPVKITRLKAPKITGTPKVSRTLRATRGAWEPQNVTVKFRWFTKQGKKAVVLNRGAKQKLRLTQSLRGKRVRVRVTVSKPGHRTTRYATAWTQRIKRR